MGGACRSSTAWPGRGKKVASRPTSPTAWSPGCTRRSRSSTGPEGICRAGIAGAHRSNPPASEHHNDRDNGAHAGTPPGRRRLGERAGLCRHDLGKPIQIQVRVTRRAARLGAGRRGRRGPLRGRVGREGHPVAPGGGPLGRPLLRRRARAVSLRTTVSPCFSDSILHLHGLHDPPQSRRISSSVMVICAIQF